MAEPVRIGLDGDVLPTPTSRTDEFLAAIFDELRALRLSGLSPAAAEPAPEETVELREPVLGFAAESVPDGETRVIELTPEPPAADVLAKVAEAAKPTEAAAAALRELGVTEPSKPAVKRTTRKRAPR